MLLDDTQLQTLMLNSEVLTVEEDASVQIAGNVKNDSSEKLTWNVSYVNADKVQEEGYTGKKVKIAVFDTGIDTNSSDLELAGGISFVDGVTSYTDDNGHGTAMASILASLDNKEGILGVAPDIKLYSVKVLDSNGTGSYSSIIQGLEWAIDNEMDIIAMSFGGTQYSAILEDIISEAVSHNILIVAAAGNEGSNTVNFPAKYSKVVCVGAVDSSGEKAGFSNSGPEMDLTAPGVNIETISKGNNYVTVSGTSAAVPHVAGVAAQILSADKQLQVDDLKAILYMSATPLPDVSRNDYGWGIVNALNSLDNIDENLVLDENAEIDIQFSEPYIGADGTVNISYIMYGDYQTITVGQTAEVRGGFHSAHNQLRMTVETPSGAVLYTEYRQPIWADAYVTFTTPAFTTAGQYIVRYHCMDNTGSTYDDLFHITVNAAPTPSPTPTPTPTDDYGNSAGSAYTMSLSAGATSSINGTLEVYNDVDYFRFTAPSTGTFTLYSSATSVDVKASLYNSTLILMASDDDSGGNANFSITTSLTQGQVYYMAISHYNSNGTGNYTFNITAPAGDTSAPTVPTLTKTGQTSANATFSWTASSDNIGVIAYDIYRNGSLISSVTNTITTYSDTISSLSPGTYNYTVKARDAVGNSSASSNTVSVVVSTDDYGNDFANAYIFNVSAGTTYLKNGNLEVTYDYDFFKFTVPTTGSYTISTTGTTDTMGQLYDSNTNPIGSEIDDVTDRNFVISASLTANTTYYVRVRGWSTSTGAYTLKVQIPAPDDYGNTTANAYNIGAVSTSGTTKTGNLEVSYDMDFFKFTVSTAGDYTIRTSGSTDTMGQIYNSSGVAIGSEIDDVNGLNFAITSTLTANTTYYARVRGFGSSIGAYTLAISSAPSKPINLVKTNQTSTSVSLSWTASNSSLGISGYKVYRGTTLVGSPTTTSFTHTITPTTSSGTYVYTVKAIDSAGNWSLASNSVSVDAQLPTAPANLSASDQTSSSVTLSWTASTDNVGVVGYKIYRNAVLIKTTTSTVTTYTDNTIAGLGVGTYNYTIRAYDAVGNTSTDSNVVGVIITQLDTTSQNSYPLTWPVPSSTQVTRWFGEFDTICNDFHNGIDVQAAIGTDVVSSVNGIVVYVGKTSNYGNVVYINTNYNGKKVQLRYACMQDNSIMVTVGTNITAGTVIGKVGTTGNVSGVTSTKGLLYLEVLESTNGSACLLDGSNATYVNPAQYMEILISDTSYLNEPFAIFNTDIAGTTSALTHALSGDPLFADDIFSSTVNASGLTPDEEVKLNLDENGYPLPEGWYYLRNIVDNWSYVEMPNSMKRKPILTYANGVAAVTLYDKNGTPKTVNFSWNNGDGNVLAVYNGRFVVGGQYFVSSFFGKFEEPSVTEGFAYAVGMYYLESEDIFASNYYPPIQEKLGYCSLYDDAAFLMSFAIDCEPFEFITEDGEKWMIELWKGQYAGSTGAEVGIYRNGIDVNIPFYGKATTWYECALDDRMVMSYTLKNNGTTLFRREDIHWWETGFDPGIFSNPDDLVMDLRITLKDVDMARLFETTAQNKGYSVTRDECNVTFTFGIPKIGGQRATDMPYYNGVQAINSSFCNIINDYKSENGLTSNNPHDFDVSLLNNGVNGLEEFVKINTIILNFIE